LLINFEDAKQLKKKANTDRKGEKFMEKGAIFLLAIMVLCVVLAPLIAYLVGEWCTYWGHAILAIIFALAAVLLKTRWYWED
jgi:hypothetical protein